jgi:Carboxypeptidase regulatory-like domain/TonB dependent receptor-like, beta-barrel
MSWGQQISWSGRWALCKRLRDVLARANEMIRMVGARRTRQLSLSVIVVGLLVTCIGATAQSVVTGAITGTLTDASKAAMQTVDVLARNLDTKWEGSATTDDEGRFRVMGLHPGLYTIEVNARGFESLEVANVVVEVGRVTMVNISLDPAHAGVRPAASHIPGINTTSQDFSVNLTQTWFNDLPNNGRRWSNFAILAPATTTDGPFGGVSFRGISSLLNNNSINGGDNNQAFLSNERGGTRIGYGIGLASIREVHINVSNYSAEYGRAAGGVINAITKSGTNRFHGSPFFYDRDNKWGARNPRGFQTVSINGAPNVVPLKPVDRRYQFGGALGGPLLENRLFFFGSYDQQRRTFPAVSTTSDPAFFGTVDRGTTGGGLKAPSRALSDAQIDSTLTFINSLTGEVPRRGDQTIYTPKVDWHITSQHVLSATYNRLRWNSPAGFDTAPTSNRGRTSFGDDFVNIDWIAVGLVSRMSSRLANELRGQFGRDQEFAFSQTPAPGEPLTGPHGKPPSISIQGGIIFGKPIALDARAFPDEKRWQYADAVTLMLRDHTIKAGFDFNHVNSRRDNLPFEEGNYTYSTINDFIIDYANVAAAGALRGAGSVCSSSTRIAGQCYAGNYTQSFGRAAFRFKTNDYGFFFQDDYRLTSRVTLNLGLRYEYQQLPKPQVSNQQSNLPGETFGPEQTLRFPSDKNDFEPRLGFAYDLSGTGRTTLRGGYGIYHGRIPNGSISDAINRTGTPESQSNFQFNPSTSSGAPVFPNTFTAPPGAQLSPNIVLFDPKMKHPFIHEGDLVFEHELRPNTVLSGAYLFSAGRGLPTFVDTNLPAPTSRTYGIIGGDFNGHTLTVSPFFAGSRPDPRFGIITAIRSLIKSDYHAFVLQLNGRPTNTLQFGSSYTLSTASDSGQNSTSFVSSSNYPSNPLDLSADQGPSDFDARHKITANAVWSPSSFSLDHRLARSIVNGLTLSSVFLATSGEPYSAGVAGSAAGGLRAGITGGGLPSLSRFPLYSRNAFRLPKIVNVNLRISRRFRITSKASLECFGEAFNLFNRTQVTELNTTMYGIGGTVTASTLTFDPAFQTVSAAGNNLIRERQLQFAVRMEF